MHASDGAPVVCVPKKTLLVSLLLICRNTQINTGHEKYLKKKKN